MELISGVHPNLAHLSWMPGSWRGVGFAEFNDGSTKDVEYSLSFTTTGEEFISYQCLASIIDLDGQKQQVLLNESGTWYGQAPNTVRLQVGAHDSEFLPAINTWHGKSVVANIEDAKITLARVDLKHENYMRQYGIGKDQFLFIHEVLISDATSSVVKLEVIMQRAS
jgi:hypothetical protein